MKKILAPIFAAFAMLFAVAGSAYAALPTGVSDGITAATTDGSTAVGLLAAFGAGLYLIVKVLRRLGIMG